LIIEKWLLVLGLRGGSGDLPVEGAAWRETIGRSGARSAEEEPRNGVAFFGAGEKGGARKLMRRDSRLDRLPNSISVSSVSSVA
jgi:hypothetical protein